MSIWASDCTVRTTATTTASFPKQFLYAFATWPQAHPKFGKYINYTFTIKIISIAGCIVFSFLVTLVTKVYLCVCPIMHKKLSKVNN